MRAGMHRVVFTLGPRNPAGPVSPGVPLGPIPPFLPSLPISPVGPYIVIDTVSGSRYRLNEVSH